MAHSPLAVPFTALGKTWHLKFGNRAQFRAEQEFGTGFAAILIHCFPDITPAMIASGSADSMATAMTNLAGIRVGSLAMLFTLGVVEPIDESTGDAITAELGAVRICELIAEAINSATPKPRKDAAADAEAGEAPPGTATPPS